MSSVDTRVVEMRFDNDKFEKGVKDTLKSLDELTEGVNKAKSADGLEVLASASKTYLEGIDNSMRLLVQNTENQLNAFKSTLSFGGRYLIRLKDRVISTFENWGKQIVLEAPGTGWDLFSKKADSVQTIMSSTGASLETVNDALNELNEYSNKTIYSFDDMTQNIGKFTNAGVELPTAVASIKGIANAAALAGASSNEASRAMYNFSQALASGSVRLIDWKSIENANMATVQFKQTLIDAAVEAGTLKKTVKKDGTVIYKTATKAKKVTLSATQGFNDSLKTLWLTSDVLTNALGQYADETTDIGSAATKAATKVRTFSKMMDALKEATATSWSTSWQHIFGDLENGTKLFSGINDRISAVLDSTGDWRNSVLATWEQMGGQRTLRKTIFDIIDIFVKLGTSVKDGFEQAFNIKLGNVSEIASRLYKFTQRIAVGIDSFKRSLNDSGMVKGMSRMDLLRSTFKNIFAVLKPIYTVFKNVGRVVAAVVRPAFDILIAVGTVVGDVLADLVEPINGIIDGIGDFFVNLLSGVKANSATQDFFGKLGEALKNVGTFVKGIPEKISNLFETIKKNEKVQKFLEKLGATWNKVVQYFFGYEFLGIKHKGLFAKLFDNFKELPFVKDSLTRLGDWWENLKKRVTSGDFAGDIADKLSAMLDWIKKIPGVLANARDWVKDKMLAMGGGMASLSSMIFGEGDGKSPLTNMFSSITEKFDFSSIIAWKDSVVKFFADIFDGLFSAVSDEGAESASDKGESLLGAIVRLTLTTVKTIIEMIQKSVEWLSTANLEDIKKAVETITPILTGLMDLVFRFKTYKNLNGITAGFSSFVGGIGELGDKIGKLDPENFNLKSFIFGSEKDDDEKQTETLSNKLLKIAGAIALLCGSLWLLSKIPANDIGKVSLLLNEVIGVMIGLMVATSKLGSGNFGGELLKMSGGIGALSLVVWLLSKIPTKDFADGILKLTALGVITALMTKITQTAEGKKVNAGPMIALAFSLVLMLIPLKVIASMNADELTQGLVGLGAVMAEMAIVAQAFRSNKTRFNTGPMISLALAMALMCVPLYVMAKMDPEGLVVAVVAMGAVMLEMGIAAQAFRGSNIDAKPMVALAFAMLLMAVPLAVIGRMKMRSILKGVVGLAAIVAAMVVVAKGANKFKAGPQLILMSLALVAMSGVMWILSQLSWDGIAKAAVGLTAISAAMLAMALIGKVKINGAVVLQNLGWFAAIGAIITAVVFAIGKLDELTGGVVSNEIGAVFEMIGGWIGRLINGIGSGASGTMAQMGKDFESFGNAIKGIDGKTVESAQNLAKVLLAVTGIQVVGTIDSWMEGMGKMFGIISDEENVITNADGTTKTVSKMEKTLYDFASAMNAYASVLKTGGFDATLVQKSQDAVDVILYILKNGEGIGDRVLDALFGKSDWSDMPTKMTNFVKAMSTYSGALMDPKNNIDQDAVKKSKDAVGLISEIMANGAPREGGIVDFILGSQNWDTLPDKMTNFVLAMSAYSKALSENEIKTGLIEQSKAAADLVMELLKGAPRNGGVLSWILGEQAWNENHSNYMTNFGLAMAAYSQAIADVDTGKVTNSQAAAELLLSLAKEVPSEGGLLGFIMGNPNFEGTTSFIVKFGEAMVAYSNSLTSGNFNASAVKESETAANLLIKLAGSVPKDGGLLGFVLGNKNFEGTNAWIVGFGEAMASYSQKLQNGSFQPELVESSMYAAQAMVALANEVPRTDGLIQQWKGSPDFTGTNAWIAGFGEAMASYSQNIAGKFDKSAVEASMWSAQSLIELSNEIPKEGGLLQKLMGSSGYEKLNTWLPAFGEAMAGYSNALERGGFNSDIATQTSTLVEALATIISASPVEGSLLQLFGVDGSQSEGLSNMSEQLGHFGEGVTAFGAATESINIPSATAAAELGASLTEMFTALGSYSSWLSQITGQEGAKITFDDLVADLGTLSDGLIDFASSLNVTEVTQMRTALAVVNDILDTLRVFDAYKSNMNGQTASEMGSYLGTVAGSMIQALEGSNVNIQNDPEIRKELYAIGGTLGSGLVAGIKGEFDAANIGMHICTGIAEGLNTYSYVALSAMVRLAKAVIAAGKITLLIASPSKEFAEMGMYIDQGLAQGISKHSSDPEKAVSTMADRTIETAKGTLATLTNQIANDIDPTVRIRPVLDLDEMMAGVGRMNGMLGPRNVTVNGTTNRLANAVANSEGAQVTNSAAMMGAINERIDALSGQMANMAIYLDSGELVGGLRDKMDKSLGRVAGLKLRTGG